MILVIWELCRRWCGPWLWGGAPPATNTATVLALHGDLGAGKTTFVQILAKSLGVSETVTSPTFVIMKGYATTDARWPHLAHIDTYRFEDESEALPLHLPELFTEPQTLVCVEWAERIENLLPAHTVHLSFTLEGVTRMLTVS